MLRPEAQRIRNGIRHSERALAQPAAPLCARLLSNELLGEVRLPRWGGWRRCSGLALGPRFRGRVPLARGAPAGCDADPGEPRAAAAAALPVPQQRGVQLVPNLRLAGIAPERLVAQDPLDALAVAPHGRLEPVALHVDAGRQDH